MPHQIHSRTVSWGERPSDGYPYYASAASKSQVNVSSTQKLQGPRRIAAMVESALYLPLPYVRPNVASPPKKPASRTTPPYSFPAFPGNEPQSRKLKPIPLSLLPSVPQPIRANPRNQLQRRSPTTSSFGVFSPISPSFGPAPAVQSVLVTCAKTDGPQAEDIKEETYTLTLRTTSNLESNASRLCLVANSSQHPPAQVTLFPSLPVTQLPQIKGHLEMLASKVRAFEISTGRPTKKHNGQIMLNVVNGEREIRRLFVGLRTSWWAWLDDEDRAFQGVGWFLLDEKDEIDVETINEASRVVDETGVVRGWATGLVVWKNEGGQWSRVSEFGFARDGVGEGLK